MSKEREADWVIVKKAFTLLTINQRRFVCVPCDAGIGVIDQQGFHYGSFDSREAFREWVSSHGGFPACRLGMANLEIVNRRLTPPEVTEQVERVEKERAEAKITREIERRAKQSQRSKQANLTKQKQNVPSKLSL